MNLHVIDWAIIGSLLAVLTAAAITTGKYTTSVSAFLAANRCGRRYLIGMANAMAGVGVITLVNMFEMYYEGGFSAFWWSTLTEPALIVIALSGWIVYRFRQTRAMTLAQFFEMRYSRNFRVFAGLVAFLAGVINFGIYPAVGARFFIALCGFPGHFQFLGVTCSTYVVLMVLMLGLALLFTFIGGQIAIMVTDFIQGAFANIVFVTLIIFLLGYFTWDQISESMQMVAADRSPFHPMKMSGQEEFDLNYFLIAVVIVFYTFNSWQGTQGYNACAANAHEAKMAGVLYGWRYRVLLTVTVVVPIAALTLLHHPDFADQAAQVRQSMATVHADLAAASPDAAPEDIEAQAATLQNQIRSPFVLAVVLPTGLLGLVCAAMLAAFISTNDTYLHSWGSIFMQDVVLPFRKKPFTPRQHLWLLRGAIFGVAVFVFIFSLLFKPSQFIAMFFAITASVFVGGACSAIIGGLYWKRGTTFGAWSAMLTGMVLSLWSIVIENAEVGTLHAIGGVFPRFDDLLILIRERFTGQELSFIVMCCAITAYIVGSLLGPGRTRVANMDKLLHRGEYAVQDDAATYLTEKRSWLEKLGIDREFTKGDRLIAYVSVGWPLAWTILLLGLIGWNLAVDVPDSWWLGFWRVWTWVFTGGALGVTVWFTIGGAFDLRYLFRHLKSYHADAADDGRVEHDSRNGDERR